VVFRGVYAHKVRRSRFFGIKPMPLLRVEVTDGCVERLIRCEYSAVLLFTPLSGISVFAYALAQCELVPGGDFSF
jgi:hypothetical protein